MYQDQLEELSHTKYAMKIELGLKHIVAIKLYQDQLNELSHTKYAMKIELGLRHIVSITLYQHQLNELSHAKYAMKIEFTNSIKQYSESGPDRIVNGYIALWHHTLSRKYSHKVLHSNILIYIMHIDTENDSIMNIVIPVRKIRKSKSTQNETREDTMENMIHKLKTINTCKTQRMITYASSS